MLFFSNHLYILKLADYFWLGKITLLLLVLLLLYQVSLLIPIHITSRNHRVILTLLNTCIFPVNTWRFLLANSFKHIHILLRKCCVNTSYNRLIIITFRLFSSQSNSLFRWRLLLFNSFLKTTSLWLFMCLFLLNKRLRRGCRRRYLCRQSDIHCRLRFQWFLFILDFFLFSKIQEKKS